MSGNPTDHLFHLEGVPERQRRWGAQGDGSHSAPGLGASLSPFSVSLERTAENARNLAEGSGADPVPTVLGHLTLLLWAPLKTRGRQVPHGAGGQMLSFSLGHSWKPPTS